MPKFLMERMDKMLDFWRPAFQLLTGVTIAHFISLLTYLYAAALIGPEGFGYFSIWLGVVLLGAVIATLRLENALVIENEGEPRLEVFAVVAQLVVGIGAVLLVMLAIAQFFTLNILPKIPPNLWNFLVPTIIAVAMNTALQALAVADGLYKRVNQLRILQTSTYAVCLYVAISIEASVLAVSGSFCLAQYCVLIYGFVSMKQRPILRFNYHHLKSVVMKHWRFPVFSLPSDSLSNFGALLPVVLFGGAFGPVAAGQLAFAIRILGAPVGVLAKAIQDVFKRQAMVDLKSLGNCRALYLNIILVLIPMMLIFSLGAYFLMPPILLLIFGAAWEPSLQMVQILIPVFTLSLAARPLSYIVYLVSKQHFDLIWQGALVCATWLALVSFTTQTDTLIAYSCAYSLMYVIYLILSYRLCCGKGYHA